MLIVLTSPDALLKSGAPDIAVATFLINMAQQGVPVSVVSNHPEPLWFAAIFGESSVGFVRRIGRQDGKIVFESAATFSLAPHDVLILATKDEDVQMGKNGRAVLVAAGWSGAREVAALGIRVNDVLELREVIDLTAAWSGQWWFAGTGPNYSVRALADLSGYGKANAQIVFADKLTATVKNGGNKLNALLTVTARSLLKDPAIPATELIWGVYPSSNSSNNDTEVLSDLTHRLRTTVSRVRMASKENPLFIRHTPSAKRSKGQGGNRLDPTQQICTVHLNPFYKSNNRLKGKHVIVIDDCTTYGVSFGVAAAFLRKAGAASVTGVALGKFGNQLRYYEIQIDSDPFKPVGADGFTIITTEAFDGETSIGAQQDLRTLIP